MRVLDGCLHFIARFALPLTTLVVIATVALILRSCA